MIKPVLIPKKEEPKPQPKAAPSTKKDVTGEEEVAKKKDVNPLDALPPTQFDLYSFKTFFVNH